MQDRKRPLTDSEPAKKRQHQDFQETFNALYALLYPSHPTVVNIKDLQQHATALVSFPDETWLSFCCSSHASNASHAGLVYVVKLASELDDASLLDKICSLPVDQFNTL